MSEEMWNLTGRTTSSCRLKDLSSSLASNAEVGLLERGVRRQQNQTVKCTRGDLQINGYGLGRNQDKTRRRKIAKRYPSYVILISSLYKLEYNSTEMLQSRSKYFLPSRASRSQMPIKNYLIIGN